MIHWLVIGMLTLQAGATSAPGPGGEGPPYGAGDAVVATLRGEPLDDAVARVASRLRCPVCQQLSILDSPAELAQEMKAVVREKLAAGESEEEVVAYFVSKYGEWVLLDPPKRGFNLVVWLGPLVLLLGGGAALAFLFSRWLRAGPGVTDEERRHDRTTPFLPTVDHR